MNINGIYFNYYQVCKRKLWLFANGINMEHTSDTVYDGKLLHETSYPQRAERYEEMLISAEYEGITLIGQIDYFDARNKVIHEIKRSDKVEEAHVRQVKFYLWLLELNGVDGATGILEYPRLRKTDEVLFSDEDRQGLQKSVSEIRSLIENESCPSTINAKICKNCSYYDFCYAGEE
ncbi:CRISPR-associated protein Cas4 [Tannerella forsythia 92A2]|uniref:CRISPR-associated exonuclease Cas4 n=1 Tax=Tannerella forsythia (strain ATCC 43037 / JCM 10827 / CCUG 21028 A / KCTC 5666 / FDC 338) TaxID=203275 RepID=G8UKC3_TANFA|nr:CRISPR-associated protein Cas4 [Tannerella forsythia]AEW22266.1 CRISPR-associated protein Cas4 [Tannerella forsythia 92A2]